MRLKINKFFNYLFGLGFFLLQGCYSLSGISTTANTIQVGNFVNQAPNGPANLGQDFTERLKEYYQRNSSLSIVENNGELIINGYIARYDVVPIANTSNDEAAQNRLEISVSVDFVDTIENTNSFNQSFSFFFDFSQEQTLDQVEPVAVDEIFEQIILDIFSKTLTNW